MIVQTLTANEAKTQFGHFIDLAQREPVRVMRRDRVVGVMVSAGPADGLVFSMGATSLLESTCGQSYKTFYVRKLEMFVINWSACPMQAFPG